MITLSIVTPVYNGDKYLRQTIESVLSQQGDFGIEYIVIDGQSTDSTLEIIKEYKSLVDSKMYKYSCKNISFHYISEKDAGMYDAINKGFRLAHGDIYAWINSDDYYLPGTFDIISQCFQKFTSIDWIKGITCILDQDNKIPRPLPCYTFNQRWIQKGYYGRYTHFIHQDSVFWRKSLWDKVGGIDSSLKLAGDYWLWIRLSQYAPLYSINKRLSVFRKRPESLSHVHMETYRTEQNTVYPKQNDIKSFLFKLFFWTVNMTKNNTVFRFDRLYTLVFKHSPATYIEIQQGSPIMKKVVSCTITKTKCHT